MLEGSTPTAVPMRFSETEPQGGAPVCVLGTTVHRELFGAQDPPGASIRIGGGSCVVAGVLPSKTSEESACRSSDFLARARRELSSLFHDLHVEMGRGRGPDISRKGRRGRKDVVAALPCSRGTTFLQATK